MYVECGLIDDARRMFDETSERSVVSWTVLLGSVVMWEGLEKGSCCLIKCLKEMKLHAPK